MNIVKVENLLRELGQPGFRMTQIKKAIYQDGVFSFSEISCLPKNIRDVLEKEVPILSFEVVEVLVSKDKKSAKAVAKLFDGNFLETVLMSPKDGFWSVCVSSQVGCPLNCQFCATGKNGFKRNLTAEEIVDQVLFWKQWLYSEQRTVNSGQRDNSKITNIVYMGMGEPFLNWGAVSESLRLLTDKNFFGMGFRSISISTAGLAEGIEKLVAEFPQVNLAISLHFAADEKRNQFMPVNKKYNLEILRQSLRSYFQKSNRKVFIEYIMFNGINDSLEDAKSLLDYLRSIGKMQLLHVNLISYNDTSNNLRPSDKRTVEEFKSYLLRHGINVTVRKSLGQDIFGACGQLAGKR